MVVRFSGEVEYRAMTHRVCELIWLQILLSELRICGDGPMRLYCDNKVAINIAHNLVQHDRIKHVD